MDCKVTLLNSKTSHSTSPQQTYSTFLIHAAAFRHLRYITFTWCLERIIEITLSTWINVTTSDIMSASQQSYGFLTELVTFFSLCSLPGNLILTTKNSERQCTLPKTTQAQRAVGNFRDRYCESIILKVAVFFNVL